MANVKISELTAITSSSDLADADIIPVVDNSDSTTKKVALSVLDDFWSGGGGSSVWCTGEDTAYLLTDCVGIGTATPEHLFSVAGNAGFDEYLYHNGDSDTAIRFQTDIIDLRAGNWSMMKIDQDNGKITVNNSNQNVDFQVKSDDGTQLIRTDAGNNRVGIGTGAPAALFHVQGDSCYTGDLKISGDVCIGGDDLFMNTNTSGYMLIADGTNFNPVAMSGDIAIDSAGATTIQATSVDNSMLAGSIANAKLSNSSVSYGGISLSLGGTDATPAFCLCDATAYKGDSALVTVGTIASGTWNGTAIANGYLANSSITLSDGSNTTAISLGGTMTFSGTTNEIEVAESSGTLTIGLPSVVTGLTTVCATNLAGTLATAAQTNVTSLGTLTALTVDNICLDGTTIGHTSDTDLMTVADGLLTVTGCLNVSNDVYTDSIRRYTNCSTTTKILLNKEVIKLNAGHSSNEVVKIVSGAVTIDGDLTICGDDLVMGTNTSGYLLIADGTNYNPVAMSGDIAIDNAGATTIQATSVDNSMLAGSIANAKLSNSSVSYGGISLSLGGTDATPAFNLCDATAYKGDSALVTSGALNSGSITSGFGTIDTGSSTITTTGAVSTGDLTSSGDVSLDGGAFVFNESGADKDFRIEGDSDANLFIADASTDRIGIGTATPDFLLSVAGNAGFDEYIYHNGDDNTAIRFQTDIIDLRAGNWSMVKIDQDNNKVTVNNANHDVDFRVNSDDGTQLIRTDAENNRVGIGTGAPAALFHVEGAATVSSLSVDDGNITNVGDIAVDTISGDADSNTTIGFPGSDIMTFNTAGNEALNIDADGAITKPLNPAFLTCQTTAQTNLTGDGTFATVNFGTEVFDQGGNLSGSTFTAPVSGRYQFTVHLRPQGLLSGHTAGFIYMRTSNNNYQPWFGNPGAWASAGEIEMASTMILDMDAADTAYVQIYVAGSTKVVDIPSGAQVTFAGYLIA